MSLGLGLLLVPELAIFVGCMLLSVQFGQWQGVIVLTLMAIGLGAPLAFARLRGGDLALFLLVPTILSASQNVYLLLIATAATEAQIQFLTIVNFLYALLALLILRRALGLADPRRQIVVTAIKSVIVLAAYGAVTVVLFHGNATSAFASLRNLVTPMLFLLLGIYASRQTRPQTYMHYLSIMALLVVLFGLYELRTPNFWQHHDLASLWIKKGLPINPGLGTPGNFFTSEIIGTGQARRMVASFADPVNLGTFLLASFFAAWFLRRPITSVVVGVGVILAVSKGALLGILVLLVVWTRYRAGRFVFGLTLVLTAGIGLVAFSFFTDNSTGSTTAHVGGLTAALTGLPRHPLGTGLGNAGILGGLFGGTNSDVVESGFGVVIGQLGLVGLGVYFAFFARLFKAAVRIADTRLRLLTVGLLAAFVFNAAFNEVALSPNSAAPFFVIVGLVLGRTPEEAEAVSSPNPPSDGDSALQEGTSLAH
jgi:hypothetical protein